MQNAAMNSGKQSIKDILSQNGIDLNLRCCGDDDLFVNLEIKSVAEKKEKLDSLFSNHPLTSFSGYYDYYDFLLARKIARFGDLIQVRESDFLKKLAEEAEHVFQKEKSYAIKYINSHAYEIFSDDKTYCQQISLDDKKKYGQLKYASVDFMMEFNGGIKEDVFKYMVMKCAPIIMSRFDDKFLDALNNKPENKQKLFTAMFPSGRLNDVCPLGLKNVLKIWSHENNKKYSPCRELIERCIEELRQDTETLCQSLSSDNILGYVSVIKAVNTFLQEINSPKADDFAKYAEAADRMVTEHLRRRANQMILSVPDGEDIAFKDILTSDSDNKCLISLTHSMTADGISKKYESFLVHIPKDWLETAVTNVRSDGIFPAGSEKFSQAREWMNSKKFQVILADSQQLGNYLNNVLSEVRFISEKLSVQGNELEKDAGMLFPMLKAVASKIAEPGPEQQMFCYTSSIFLCSLIEKLLRLFNNYLCQSCRSDETPPSDVTLNGLLDANSSQSFLKTAFELDYLQMLAYFLIRIPETNIGKNYRNRLAHWADGMTPENMKPALTSGLLWIFTDVLNSVFLYFESQIDGSAQESCAAEQ